jgi:hypothetical protein
LQPAPTAEAAVEIILICQQPGMLPAAESAVHKKMFSGAPGVS